MQTEMYFDGLCEPINPGGHGAFGYVIKNSSTKISGNGYIGGGGTNNQAEYSALIAGLQRLVKMNIVKDVVVLGDSQLAICQMTGEYDVKSSNIIDLHCVARDWTKKISNIEFKWIPREQNEKADIESRLALNYIYEDRLDEMSAKYKIENCTSHVKLTSPENKIWMVKRKYPLYSCNCPSFKFSNKMEICKHTAFVYRLDTCRKNEILDLEPSIKQLELF